MKQSAIQEYVLIVTFIPCPSPSSRIVHVSQDVPSAPFYWSCMSPAVTTPRWISQATILKSILSQRTRTLRQNQAKNSQKEENTSVIQSENVCHSSLFSLLYCLQSLQRRARSSPCFDLQNSQRSRAQNSLHCQKGTTLLISPHPLHSLHHTHRVSQRNTQNGPLVPPFPLNTILTINFATQPTGTRQIAALNGPLVIMLKKKNHHETMNLSILTPNPINFISKSKLTVVWRLKK